MRRTTSTGLNEKGHPCMREDKEKVSLLLKRHRRPVRHCSQTVRPSQVATHRNSELTAAKHFPYCCGPSNNMPQQLTVQLLTRRVQHNGGEIYRQTINILRELPFNVCTPVSLFPTLHRPRRREEAIEADARNQRQIGFAAEDSLGVRSSSWSA